LELAASEFQRLVSEQPNNNHLLRNLAGTYFFIARSKAALHDNEGALDNYQKVIDMVRGMIKVDPADARAKTTLAASLIQEAAVLMNLNRMGEAKTAGAEALAFFRSFADRPQATPDDLNNYASYLSGITVPALKDPETALAYSKRALSMVKDPSLVLLITLTDAYFRVGDLNNAILTARRALAENPAQPGAYVGIRVDLEKKLREMEERKEEPPAR
jgi:tetratricopeptide (TPR) repeat protein